MTDIKHAFTPYTVSQDEALIFTIPLYQRLFEWGEEQITQLLDDLYSSYTRNPGSPYYIGMLTTKETETGKELVDGQQRFTALILLGVHFGWSDFLQVSDKTRKTPRLQFTARDEDKEYLMAKINGEDSLYKNDKMEKGLKCIKRHLEKEIKLNKQEEKEFGDYIFHYLTFFLSKLPQKYSSQELNTYFERMNTSGKSLENYEILKVDMLRRLNEDKEKYTLLWNSVSIMEKMMLRKHNNESLDHLRKRYFDAITNIFQGSIENAFEKPHAKFDLEEEDDADEEFDDTNEQKSIGDIEPNPENPYKIVKRRTDEHALLTFPEFLLQVLYICLDKKIGEQEIDGIIDNGINTTDFFDVRKLNKTFTWAFDKRKLDAESFLLKLGLYRLLTDYFIIRMNDEDEEPYPFMLYSAEEDQKMKVRMYLAMLYSASSPMTYYMWMPDLLLFLENHVQTANALELNGAEYLHKLKEMDNQWHPKDEIRTEKLTFNTIDRYWFWRIDYFLWEQRELFFKTPEQKKVVQKYVFRRNRSIEHIAPQHPKDEYGDKQRFNWDDENLKGIEEKRDCLGNMVMISSGQNSSLTNSCFEVKRAVMQRYASGIGNGSVESLKMLYVYSMYDRWSIDNINAHQAFSIGFLNLTYIDKEEDWRNFAKTL